MRRPLAAVAAVAAHLAVSPAGATEPAPILYYWAASDAPPAAAEARAALDDLARRRGTALVDRSPAAREPPRAPLHLRRAIEAYQAFRHDEALALLERALAEAADTGAAGLTPSELSDLLIYRALVHEQRGDQPRAWDDFLGAAVVDPSRRLDPVRFSPRIVESFARATQKVTAEPTEALVIDAPAACGVFIDGRSETPGQPIPLRRGEHYLRADCAGMLPWAERITIDGARTVRPALVTERPPADRELVADARTRGARTLIAVTASAGAGPATVLLRLIDGATGKERARAVMRLDRGRGTAVAAAAERMIDDVVRPAAEAGPSEPWYRSWQAWTWVGGGVVAGALAGFLLVRAVDAPAADSWTARLPIP